MSAIDPHGIPTHAEAVDRDSPAEWARIESRHTSWLVVVGLLGAALTAAGVLAIDHGWVSIPFGGGR